MKIFKRYPGSSLVLTIIISLVLSLISSSLIFLSYLNRLAGIKNDAGYILEKNVRSAVNLILSDTAVNETGVRDSLDLFGEGNDSVSIYKRIWGTYHCGVAVAHKGRYSKQLVFFYGNSLPDSFSGCLYLADHGRPLVVARSASLNGNLFLPLAGVKRDRTGPGEQGIDNISPGNFRQSNNQLPELHPVVLNSIRSLLQLSRDSSRESSGWQAFENGTYKRAFTDEPLLLSGNKYTILDECSMSGQVILVSDSLIEINSSSALDNIIVAAPVVRIKKGFRGRVQVFATDSLLAEDSCSFEYPSTLVLMKEPGVFFQNRLVVGKYCKLSGIIVSVCGSQDFYKSYMQVGKETRIEGVVFASGYLELAAGVSGTVLADYFLAKTPAVTYENYLIDAEISRDKLSAYFISSPLFRGGLKNAVIQWIN